MNSTEVLKRAEIYAMTNRRSKYMHEDLKQAFMAGYELSEGKK